MSEPLSNLVIENALIIWYRNYYEFFLNKIQSIQDINTLRAESLATQLH